MKKLRRITIALGICLILIMNGFALAAEVPICTQTANQRYPDIYGDKIVWEDIRSGNYDIYLYDLSTGTETAICTQTSNQENPSIYGNRIVWQDLRNGNSDIYMHDLSTSAETPICTQSSSQTNPVIYGNMIVWQDGRNGNNDIYMYNLSTGTETAVCTQSDDQTYPDIYGDNIVWQDARNAIPILNPNNNDIYRYNLTTGTESSICTQSSNQQYPSISGTRIVWQDARNAGLLTPNNNDIFMYNLTTSSESSICTQSSNQQYPGIYGNTVVWQDSRNSNSDIYMYNLTTSTESSICTQSANQQYPAVYEDKVVWEDIRSGNYDIYLNDFAPPTTSISTNPTSPDGTNGWFKTAPTVTLTRNEPGTSYYSWTSSTGPWTTYSGSFTAPEGENTLYCYSVDFSGNPGSVTSQSFKVDTGAPASSITAPADGARLRGATYNIQGIASDTSSSGLAKVEISINDGAWIAVTGATSWSYSWTLSSDGSYNIKSRATDNAGNQETVGSGIDITVDNTQPTVSSTNPNDLDTNVPITANISATFSEEMDNSTITSSNFTLKDSLNNPISGSVSYNQSSKTATFDPSGNLDYSETYTATATTGVKDLAGNNTASDKVWTFTTSDAPDTTPPITAITLNPATPDGNDNWYITTPSVTLTSNEPGTTYYSWTSSTGSWTTYSGSFTAPEGENTLYYYSIDSSSNTETVKNTPMKVDVTSPSTSTLSGSAPNPTQIDLSWSAATDNIGVSGYNIYNADTDMLLAVAFSTSRSFTGLTSNTTYRYYVKSYDQAGNISNESNTLTIAIPSAPPAPPTGLTAKVGDMKNNLTWDPVSGATYKIYRSTSSTGTFNLITPTPISSTSYMDEPGTKGIYYYKISSVVGGSESDLSASIEADFVDMDKTISPTGGLLDALNGAVSVQLPDGALSSSTDISVLQMTTTPSAPIGLRFVSKVYDFGPSATSFNPDHPITITLKYDATLTDPNKIDIYWYDGSSWQKITDGRTVNTSDNTISIETTHFTPFVVMSSGYAVSTGVNTGFVFLISILAITGGFVLIRRPRLFDDIK